MPKEERKKMTTAQMLERRRYLDGQNDVERFMDDLQAMHNEFKEKKVVSALVKPGAYETGMALTYNKALGKLHPGYDLGVIIDNIVKDRVGSDNDYVKDLVKKIFVNVMPDVVVEYTNGCFGIRGTFTDDGDELCRYFGEERFLSEDTSDE